MKTQGWYKVIKDEEYFKEFLGIFSEFHDYRITHIEYDFEKNHLMLYLRYDTDEEGRSPLPIKAVLPRYFLEHLPVNYPRRHPRYTWLPAFLWANSTACPSHCRSQCR